jgi:Reverse transcriptase (RNA-dependent DNA polymerase)
MPNNCNKSYHFNQSPLYCVRSRRKLAALLDVSLSSIDTMLKSGPKYFEYERSDNNSRKKRLVEEPRGQLKRIQLRLDSYLSRIAISEFIHSPAKNKSHLTNARVHKNNCSLMKLDIASYFASTRSQAVFNFFCYHLRCSQDVSAILTNLSTHNGHLPTGSPCSPRLAYFSYMKMWSEIHEIAYSAGYTLTVYADDISISGSHVSLRTLWEIKQKIVSYGLKYHKEKIYHFQPFEVTGIVISNQQALVPNRHLKKSWLLRTEIQQEPDPSKRERLQHKLRGVDGYTNYVRSQNES